MIEKSRVKIFVVDDDASLCKVIVHQLSQEGYSVSHDTDPIAARTHITAERPTIVISDLRMPGLSGHDILAHCRADSPATAVIVMTGYPTVDDAVEAMRVGAFDILQKPVDRPQLLRVIDKACEMLELRRENSFLRTIVDNYLGLDQMVGQSPAMQKVYAEARQVAQSSANLVIFGETGTGKELLAKSIHRLGPRVNKPFEAINCAAIPADLLESELFGHVKGSFAGATEDRSGRILASAGGTLFLDEIGDLPPSLQPKLLRVLQEKVVEPIGARQAIPVDFRLICATHRDLLSMVKDGLFREDLFYRIQVVPIELPPLRARREDIALLFMRFLRDESTREKRQPLEVDPLVLREITAQEWPGNVRELENLARRLFALNVTGKVGLEDLPWKASGQGKPSESMLCGCLPEEGFDLEYWTDQVILKALAKNEGNKSRTARYLGISRNTLQYRMEKHGLGEIES